MNALTKTMGQSQIEAARFAASHLSAEFLAAVNTVVKAKEDWEGGPVTICTAIDKYIPEAVFDTFPVPGSEGGNNPAKFKMPVPSGKDGKLKDKDFDYYAVFADSLAPAVAWYQEKDWLERLGNDKMKTDGIPADFINQYQNNAVARDNRLAKVKNKITAYRQSIKNGFVLKFQLLRVNELSGCHAQLVPNAEGTGFENRVRVRSTLVGREMEDNEGMTLKAFMKLDPMAAFKNGATWHALMATKKRQQEEGAETGAIKTAEAAKKTFEHLHLYLDGIVTDSKQEQYSSWVKFLNSKAGDATLSTLIDVRTMLDEMLAKVHKPGERKMAYDAVQNAAAA